MKETIILASGINASELRRNLALRGNNYINLRVYKPVELAHMALMRSGTVITDFINENKEIDLIAKALKDVNEDIYFDIQTIADDIRQLRNNVLETSEEDELFDKESCLFKVYKNYKKIRKQRLDSVGLIRRAIAEYREFDDNCNPMKDTKFVVLKEFPLSSLEEKLLRVISPKKASKISLYNFFNKERINNNNSPNFCCFETMNKEVKWILNECYKKERLDQYTIAVTDPKTYMKKILDLDDDFGVSYYKEIPITFGCGIIRYSNPGKLLQDYKNIFLKKGNKNVKYNVYEMICKEYFNMTKLNEELKKQFCKLGKKYDSDKFKEFLENLKLTQNKDIIEYIGLLNNYNSDNFLELGGSCIPCLKFLAEKVFAMPIEDFIEKYCVIRSDENFKNYDKTAKKIICEELKKWKENVLRKFIDNLLDCNLNFSFPGMPGKLHVTGIREAFSSMRKNLFIAGCCRHKVTENSKEEKMCKNLFELASNLGVNISVSYTKNNYSGDNIIIGKSKDYHVVSDVAPKNIIVEENKVNKVNKEIPSYEIENPSKITNTSQRSGVPPCAESIDHSDIDSKIWGKMVHKFMEFLVISKNKIEPKVIAKEIIRQFSNQLENEDEKKEVEEKLIEIANNGKIKTYLKKLLSPNNKVYCEVPYSYLKNNAGEKTTIQTGNMDVVYFSDGKWYIVDYKTNKIDYTTKEGKKEALNKLKQKYKKQLSEYKKAFKVITEQDTEEIEISLYHIDIYREPVIVSKRKIQFRNKEKHVSNRLENQPALDMP